MLTSNKINNIKNAIMEFLCNVHSSIVLHHDLLSIVVNISLSVFVFEGEIFSSYYSS